LSVVVPDPPPDRAVPGRAADRDSPKAKPLVRAAEAMIALKPEAFPFAFSSFNVTFGKTFPDAEGHGPEDPVYEVLQNVGLVTQPGVARENIGHDASSEFYVATFRFLEP
jgi:hypothetical protein